MHQVVSRFEYRCHTFFQIVFVCRVEGALYTQRCISSVFQGQSKEEEKMLLLI